MAHMIREGPVWTRGLGAAIAAALMATTASSQPSPQAGAEPIKLALVIGVSGYDRDRATPAAVGYRIPSPLANAASDAMLVGDALKEQGFTVTRVVDPDRQQLKASVDAFADEVAVHANRFIDDPPREDPDVIAIIYFSGHGAQGQPPNQRYVDNYLIPAGARLKDETDLQFEAVSLSYLAERVSPGCCGGVILFLDACRDFALPERGRGFERAGFADATEQSGSGTLIGYAAGTGQKASDGPPGGNGPYARALSAEFRKSAGSSIDDILRRVGFAVDTETDGMQTPWQTGSLRRLVRIGKPDAPSLASATGPVPLASSETEHRDRLRRDANWIEFEGSFYRLTPRKMGFHEARSWAQNREGDLVAVNSEAEQRFILSRFGDKRPLWLGLTDEEEDGTWRWLNGDPLTYDAWRPGEPSGRMMLGAFGPEEDYAVILGDVAGFQLLAGADGEWTDVSADYMRGIGSAYGIVEVRP